MHTNTTQPRTCFLATPQFGFAHLGEDRPGAEPLHDFLVVQFGVDDASPMQRLGPGRPNRLLHPAKHP